MIRTCRRVGASVAAALLVAAPAACASSTTAEQAGPVVSTTSGTLKGIETPAATEVLGVRYAK